MPDLDQSDSGKAGNGKVDWSKMGNVSDPFGCALVVKVELKTLPYEPACFAGGTLVHTKNGLVPIEQIQVGDWVLSKHESGEGEREYKRVTKTFVHEDREVIMISCGGAGADGSPCEYRFFVTAEHPFWVKGKGWKPAGKLKNSLPRTVLEVVDGIYSYVGGKSRLFKTDDPDVAWRPFSDSSYYLRGKGSRYHVPTVKLIEREVFIGIESVRKNGRVKPEHLYTSTVYNFEVEDFHTYYVGEAGVWVHNKNISRVTAAETKKPVTGYIPTPSEVAKPFYGKSELYGYLADHPAEAKNGVFVIRSSEISQIEKNGVKIDIEDLPHYRPHYRPRGRPRKAADETRAAQDQLSLKM